MNKYRIFIAWILAILGTTLSVYFRTFLHIEPCPLCWYQRMALFPLVLLLGMGIYRGDKNIAIYGLPFAVIGCLIAVYQVLGSYYPFLLHRGLCGENHPCTNGVFYLFGFLTFPMVSAIGFALIALLLVRAKSL
ncbi:MAG: disulfide bond formation protein B [Chlamydiia bacterium]|nr:disulfide bond formation protein B [Chlamydiia bacterium]